MVRSFRFLRLILCLLLLAVVLVLCHPIWLAWIGEALVRDDGPAKADMVVVLAGDYTGARIDKGAGLVRAGYATAVIVDGPAGFFGLHESDLAIDWAVRHGYPRDIFVPLPMTALSTREEAVFVMNELERRHVRTFLMVTSTYHTARAARVFQAELRKRGNSITMRPISAPDLYFHPRTWWRTRESRKTTFFEWCKTLAESVGL